MLSRTHKPFDLIGIHLREVWSDVVTAPLPDSIRCLLDTLGRGDTLSQGEKAKPQGAAGPIASCRSATNVSRARE
jgi:hypothetical protein